MDGLSFKSDMTFAYGEPSPMGPGVVRIVAGNAGPFTFKGTNTYIVGLDPEIAVMRPGTLVKVLLNWVGIIDVINFVPNLVRNAISGPKDASMIEDMIEEARVRARSAP